MRGAAITTLLLIPIYIGACWLWGAYRVEEVETTYAQGRELYWALVVAVPISLFSMHRKLLAMLFVSLLVSGTATGLVLLAVRLLAMAR